MWLKKRFGKEFEVTGDSLGHGNQEDGTDCGILAANTAAHDIFGDKLWTVGQKMLQRAQWFVKLSTSHMDEVRTFTQVNALF